MITWPRYMTLQEWSDRIILDLDGYGSFGKLDNPEHWKSWGLQFLSNAEIGRGLPDPNGFDDWESWAERFVGALA